MIRFPSVRSRTHSLLASKAATRRLASPALLWIASALAGGCFNVVKPTTPADAKPAPGEFPEEILTDALDGRITPDGLVDYAAIQSDRAKLDQFVGYIALTSPESDPDLFPTRDDQLSYWINTYNALAITGVIDRPGLTSVIDEKLDFFYLTRYKVGGRNLDLYRMENGVVRPTFSDARVHFALNCQSDGCPRLPQQAFASEGLDATLDEMSAEFCNNPKKVELREGNVLAISEIFKWYEEDFESSGGPLAFIQKYRDDVPDDATIEYITYDWSLIAQPGKGP